MSEPAGPFAHSTRLRGGLPYGPMRWLVLFLIVLILIGGGMRLAGAQLPVIDYPFGGLFFGPQIEIQQPDLHLP